MRLSTLLALGFVSTGLAAARGDGGTLILINEIRIDQPSTDNDEYFELLTFPASTSLDGLTYISIGDGSGGSGVIESVTDLNGQTSDTSGLFVVAEGSFTLGVADLVATLGFENGDNVTHLLVRDFTGALQDDLDTDDDGTLDVTPWSEVLDAVSLVDDPDGGEEIYGPSLGFPAVGPNGDFVPAHVFRCLSSLTDYRIGTFDAGISDTPNAFNDNCTASFEVFCDPGEANSVSPTGGVCRLTGTGSVQLNDSALVAEAVPDFFGVFVQGDVEVPPMMSSIGGNLCVGGNLERMNRIVSATGGLASLQLDFSDATTVESGVAVGQTFYYQYFHRDTVFPGGGNFTNGVAVTWAP
ncbi:MAG: hypothetical protein AAGB93_16965 [Planctomycetota bacterium]